MDAIAAVAGSRLVWAGGGAAGTPSRARRLRHRVRETLSTHPALYLPVARRRYPGPSPRVLDPRTEVVIDGYTRSASTFAVYAFQVAQSRPVRVAHHLHAAAQLLAAADRGLPTILVVREPRGAVLSQVVREPGVDLLDALWAYSRFHETLADRRAAFVVTDLTEPGADFGSVVERLNERFGTSYAAYTGSEDQTAWCTRLMGLRHTLSPVLLGFESGEVTFEEARRHVRTLPASASADRTWMPSADRDRAKTALAEAWSSPRLAEARARAEAAHAVFAREVTGARAS
jgi:hypothetical protein